MQNPARSASRCRIKYACSPGSLCRCHHRTAFALSSSGAKRGGAHGTNRRAHAADTSCAGADRRRPRIVRAHERPGEPRDFAHVFVPEIHAQSRTRCEGRRRARAAAISGGRRIAYERFADRLFRCAHRSRTSAMAGHIQSREYWHTGDNGMGSARAAHHPHDRSQLHRAREYTGSTATRSDNRTKCLPTCATARIALPRIVARSLGREWLHGIVAVRRATRGSDE